MAVVSLILLVCNVVPKRCRLIICPVGQRLWRPVLHVASFVRRTPLVGGWTSSSPTMRSLLRGLGFRSSGSVWSGSFSSLRLSAYCLSRGFSMYLFFVHLRLFSAWFFCAWQASVSVRAVLFVIVTPKFDVFCFLITLALSLHVLLELCLGIVSDETSRQSFENRCFPLLNRSFC